MIALQSTHRSFTSYNAVLDGDHFSQDDTEHLDNLPPLFAIVYWTNALACGLYYKMSDAQLQPMVAQVYKHLEGGFGTLMMFYARFVLSWYSIMFASSVDTDLVASTKEQLLAFRHSRSDRQSPCIELTVFVPADQDFANMAACLDVLEGLKRLERKEITWDAAADGLEDVIEALDLADHHLLRGASH